jgi:hypothetical protein
MDELSNYKDTDRVIFPRGKQREFLHRALKMSFLTWEQFAHFLHINPRLLRYYRNEEYSISIKLLERIMELSDINFPSNVEVKDQFWSKFKGGKAGGKAVMKKYGRVPVDEEERKNQWRKWWDKEGSKNPQSIFLRKEVILPKDCSDLAELFGIIIGDGGITKYQVIVTLNGEVDRLYSKFVVNLFQKLFKLKPSINKTKSKAINIVFSRSNIVDFLVSKGLKLGDKLAQNLSIPKWIMKSREYKIRCLRGMVDTDGCIFHETHKIKGKVYTYPRLNFTSASPLLVEQSINILRELGFNPTLRRMQRSVQLENIKEICEYFKVVGSSNPKHLQRISKWT